MTRASQIQSQPIAERALIFSSILSAQFAARHLPLLETVTFRLVCHLTALCRFRIPNDASRSLCQFSYFFPFLTGLYLMHPCRTHQLPISSIITCIFFTICYHFWRVIMCDKLTNINSFETVLFLLNDFLFLDCLLLTEYRARVSGSCVAEF